MRSVVVGTSGVLPRAGAGCDLRVNLGRIDAEAAVCGTRVASGIPASTFPYADCDLAYAGDPRQGSASAGPVGLAGPWGAFLAGWLSALGSRLALGPSLTSFPSFRISLFGCGRSAVLAGWTNASVATRAV